MMRIVSLLPSATEIVYALGLGDSLIGVSHDCDFPPEVASKPKLSQALISTDLPSDEIDAIVREQLHSGLSVYHLDAPLLQELKPDLILTQELCEVCAPSFDQVAEAAKILGDQTKIVSLEPRSLEDILENIRLVGELTSQADFANQIIAALRERIDRVRQITEELRERPTVACVEWLSPVMVAGHWVPELVEYAGGEDLLGEAGDPTREIAWGDLLNYDPDVLVFMPCGFSIERTLAEMELVIGREGWEELAASKNGQVYLVDASSYFNRPGPRVVTGLEIMAQIIHPEFFKGLAPAGSLMRLAFEKLD
jgi:iron complex transport system substrate-binding protein